MIDGLAPAEVAKTLPLATVKIVLPSVFTVSGSSMPASCTLVVEKSVPATGLAAAGGVDADLSCSAPPVAPAPLDERPAVAAPSSNIIGIGPP